ncbi:hypothetical protein KI387_008074, partial [Taxus chinensis]
EAWNSRNPIVSHFRVFRSIAYTHVLDQKNKKLDKKSEKYKMIGYSEESKAYRLNDPKTEEIHIKRNVWFDEDIINNSNDSTNTSSLPILIEEDKTINTNDSNE